jgi:hypothetical protein
LLAADLLQAAINKAFKEQRLSAPFETNFDMDYPVIQYADDTLIIMLACQRQISVMKDILDKYIYWATHQLFQIFVGPN